MNKTDFYGFLNIKQINLVSNCSNPFIEHCARKIDSLLQYIYMYIYICLLYFAGTELNNQIAKTVFINESTIIE